MSQHDDKFLTVKEAMAEKFIECRQNLAEFTSNSEEKLKKIDMELKTLENELAKWNTQRSASNVSTVES